MDNPILADLRFLSPAYETLATSPPVYIALVVLSSSSLLLLSLALDP